MRETTHTAPRAHRGRDTCAVKADAIQAAPSHFWTLHSVCQACGREPVRLVPRRPSREDEAADRCRTPEHPIQELCGSGSFKFSDPRCADEKSAWKIFQDLASKARPRSQNKSGGDLDDGHWIFDRFCPQEGRAPARAREDSAANSRPRSHRKTASTKRVRPLTRSGGVC